jgi:hypothetical protein
MPRHYRYAPPLHPDPRYGEPFFCDVCDHGFAADFEPDLVDHDRVHDRTLRIRLITGGLMTRSQRVAADDAARAVLRRRSAPLVDRLEAAERMIQARYDTYLRGLAWETGRLVIPTREEFAAKVSLAKIFESEDVIRAIRHRYRPDSDYMLREW